MDYLHGLCMFIIFSDASENDVAGFTAFLKLRGKRYSQTQVNKEEAIQRIGFNINDLTEAQAILDEIGNIDRFDNFEITYIKYVEN